YFSLVTMTTIGYGDIAPLNPFVRMVAVMAGVLSQFYMAVVVAVIVGRLMSQADSQRNG
ncbi:MAG: two pore domain potassium channel family protein, partial [Kiritimatiellaceae bacterium]|nr:two pore domain potassium channel family protein [Kiritimatiellaceae bacterium]